MREAKCGYCSKKDKIRRDGLRYICLECSDFIAFGREIYDAVSKNESLGALDKEPINMQQIKDIVESMRDFRKKWVNSEKLYFKEKTNPEPEKKAKEKEVMKK